MEPPELVTQPPDYALRTSEVQIDVLNWDRDQEYPIHLMVTLVYVVES